MKKKDCKKPINQFRSMLKHHDDSVIIYVTDNPIKTPLGSQLKVEGPSFHHCHSATVWLTGSDLQTHAPSRVTLRAPGFLGKGRELRAVFRLSIAVCDFLRRLVVVIIVRRH